MQQVSGRNQHQDHLLLAPTLCLEWHLLQAAFTTVTTAT
jgi:hypothetical protein